MDASDIRNFCLSLPGVEEKPHFEKTSFRMGNKIFATLDKNNRCMTLKLSDLQQSLFSAFDPTAVYPVPNSWGKKGWTIFELDKVPLETLKDALEEAWKGMAKKPKK